MLESSLIKALECVSEKGDVAPANDTSPRAVLTRERLLRDGLVTFDMDRGRYFLTASGRDLLHRLRRPSATILPFRIQARS